MNRFILKMTISIISSIAAILANTIGYCNGDNGNNLLLSTLLINNNIVYKDADSHYMYITQNIFPKKGESIIDYQDRLNSTTYVKEIEIIKELIPCPQCGVWQSNNGNLIVIDNNRVIIPRCGTFMYKIDSSVSIPTTRNDRHNYQVSMLLTQRNRSFLCSDKDGNDWNMEANIRGHFQEGSVADFKLYKKGAENSALWFDGWNMDREDPCISGSGFGSVACEAVATSLLYSELAEKLQSAYGIIITKKIKNIDFNVARFSAKVDQYCTKREQESGGGSWPHAWALACKEVILRDKLKELDLWQACLNNTKNNVKRCSFPDEKFDTSKINEE